MGCNRLLLADHVDGELSVWAVYPLGRWYHPFQLHDAADIERRHLPTDGACVHLQLVNPYVVAHPAVAFLHIVREGAVDAGIVHAGEHEHLVVELLADDAFLGLVHHSNGNNEMSIHIGKYHPSS